MKRREPRCDSENDRLAQRMAKLEEKLLDHPQLIGTSRHITGAYSIRELSWDAAGKTLHGVSEVAPGADYTLFIRCPAGMRATAGPTSLGGGRPVPVRQATNGNLLAFEPLAEPLASPACGGRHEGFCK